MQKRSKPVNPDNFSSVPGIRLCGTVNEIRRRKQCVKKPSIPVCCFRCLVGLGRLSWWQIDQYVTSRFNWCSSRGKKECIWSACQVVWPTFLWRTKLRKSAMIIDAFPFLQRNARNTFLFFDPFCHARNFFPGISHLLQPLDDVFGEWLEGCIARKAKKWGEENPTQPFTQKVGTTALPFSFLLRTVCWNFQETQGKNFCSPFRSWHSYCRKYGRNTWFPKRSETNFKSEVNVVQCFGRAVLFLCQKMHFWLQECKRRSASPKFIFCRTISGLYPLTPGMITTDRIATAAQVLKETRQYGVGPIYTNGDEEESPFAGSKYFLEPLYVPLLVVDLCPKCFCAPKCITDCK